MAPTGLEDSHALCRRCSVASISTHAVHKNDSPSTTTAEAVPQSNLDPDEKGRPWWQGLGACYQIWPHSFKDSNGDGMGDINGIISKLDYLKDLGIDLIWVSPTYRSPMNDWGYDISDYEDIEPRFGTLADMERLIEECHAREMKILMDLVITHTSDQHSWFKESRESRDNPKADWYMWADRRTGHTIGEYHVEEPSNWRAAFGGSAWEWVPERKQYYIHLFLPDQPDLNWENAAMREAVYQSAIKFWIDRGVDGFRLDTANRFGKHPDYPDIDPPTAPGPWQPGSKYYFNQPKMHQWIQEIRAKIERDTGGKDLMIVGELPLTPYNELLKYVLPERKELSMVFDFDMVKLGNNDNPDDFKRALWKVQALITNTKAWGTVFMENHDQPRSIARYATPNSRYWKAAGKLLCLLQTTLSGTEFIYQGQEIGMANMPLEWRDSQYRDPDAVTYVKDFCAAHREDPHAKDLAIEGVQKVGRDNSRTPMQWSDEPNAGFCIDNPPWMQVHHNYRVINVASQQAQPDSIWNFWKARIAMRKTYKELFIFGTFALFDEAHEKMFTYTKMADDGATALVILNFSDEELELNTPQRHLLGHTYSLLACNVRECKEKLQPWEGRVYLVREGLKADVKEVQDRVAENGSLGREWQIFEERRE